MPNVPHIHIHAGSIFDVRADVIVNPANSFLQHTGGLARVIADTATADFEPNPLDRWTTDLGGSPVALMKAAAKVRDERVRAWHADHRNAPLIATGNAHHTSPGMLDYKGVIHVVGPIWNGGGFCERMLLSDANDSILRVCAAHGYSSVVLPAVSCGVFGFPVEDAAEIFARRIALLAPTYGVQDVTIALTSDEHVAVFRHALRAYADYKRYIV